MAFLLFLSVSLSLLVVCTHKYILHTYKHCIAYVQSIFKPWISRNNNLNSNRKLVIYRLILLVYTQHSDTGHLPPKLCQTCRRDIQIRNVPNTSNMRNYHLYCTRAQLCSSVTVHVTNAVYRKTNVTHSSFEHFCPLKAHFVSPFLPQQRHGIIAKCYMLLTVTIMLCIVTRNRNVMRYLNLRRYCTWLHKFTALLYVVP
jgi:hypothetical protein